MEKKTMTIKNIAPIKKIEKVSNLFKLFCMLVLGIFIIGFLLGVYSIWAEYPIGNVNINISGMELQHPKDFSTGGKIFITLAILVYIGLMSKGFYHLKNLFSSYSKGKIFTTEANGQIKKLGVTVCLWPLCQVLCILFGYIAVHLTYGTIRMINTPPDKSVSILIPLILGAFIIYFSWVMETGREIREDQELTI
jgi:hypothetical protein